MDCDRIVGCPWMCLHLPVPGWDAVRTYRLVPVEGSLRRGDAKIKLDTSYHVKRCPLFIPPQRRFYMQTKPQGIKAYTKRGVTTYRCRCSFCGYRMPVIFDTRDAAESMLEQADWMFVTGGQLMCPDCQMKRRKG